MNLVHAEVLKLRIKDRRFGRIENQILLKYHTLPHPNHQSILDIELLLNNIWYQKNIFYKWGKSFRLLFLVSNIKFLYMYKYPSESLLILRALKQSNRKVRLYLERYRAKATRLKFKRNGLFAAPRFTILGYELIPTLPSPRIHHLPNAKVKLGKCHQVVNHYYLLK